MSFPGDWAQNLLACFRGELLDGPSPPPEEKICLRAGELVPFNLGTGEDECCTGLAWVRIARVEYVPRRTTAATATGDLVLADGTSSGCGGFPYAVVLEMGAARCFPFGSTAAGPTCDQWTAIALQQDADAAAMRKAVCCIAEMAPDMGADVVPGTWEPRGAEGGCIWGTMEVTVNVDCSEC